MQADLRPLLLSARLGEEAVSESPLCVCLCVWSAVGEGTLLLQCYFRVLWVFFFGFFCHLSKKINPDQRWRLIIKTVEMTTSPSCRSVSCPFGPDKLNRPLL